jgi:hypothetical protein
MLQVPNAAAQLMVDPLLGHGILCFEGGVRGDVFRRCFGTNDFFRKQIKAKRGNKEEVKREITQESKKQVEGKIYSRIVRFFGALSSLGCLPLSMALGFSLLEQGRRWEVMDECASGFAGHLGRLFY